MNIKVALLVVTTPREAPRARQGFAFICAAVIWLTLTGPSRAELITKLIIPINCGVIKIGDITVKVAHFDPPVGDTLFSAEFKSIVSDGAGAPPTLAAAAQACGEHHFNWYQIITVDNNPPAGRIDGQLTAPYVDPARGGYLANPATKFAEVLADKLPWFWNEGPDPAPGTPGAQAHIDDMAPPGALTLRIEDSPVGPTEQNVSGKTWLVSLNKDGSLYTFHQPGFSWDWSREASGNQTITVQQLNREPTIEEYNVLIRDFDERISILVNDQLLFRKDLSKGFYTYHPTCHFGPGAPNPNCGDVYPIDAVFEKKPGGNLSHLFFKVLYLDGPSCPCVVQNADGGPGGVGARVSVQPQYIGQGHDGILRPKDTFTQHFDIKLTRHPEGFTFFVDVFGSDP
jgi:hypothetical protein